MIIAGIIISILIVSAFCYYSFKTPEHRNKMSFKESSDLVGLPIVTFYINNIKLHFLLDTGADRSLVNSEIIESIPHTKQDLHCELVDAGGHSMDSQYSTITVYYNGKSYEGDFMIADLSALSDAIDLRVKGKQVVIAGVIGNDFFRKYQYVLDFQKLVAYSKK